MALPQLLLVSGDEKLIQAFVDCDDVHGATTLLGFVGTTSTNRSTPLIAIRNGDTFPPEDGSTSGARTQVAAKE